MLTRTGNWRRNTGLCALLALLGSASVLADDNGVDDPVKASALEAVAGETVADVEGNEAAYDEIKLFTETLLHIKRQYAEEKTYKEIVHGGLRGVLQALDPHSDFLDAEAYQALQDDAAGHFSGIGISVGIRNGELTIVAPMEDTPAFRAGLMAGDTIVGIDGDKTQGMTLREAVKRLRGPLGETVRMAVRRAGEESEREFDLVREDITVESVKGVSLVREGIGYARVTQFSEPTADALGRALAQLEQQGAKALILDLRNNHGGLLRSALDVAQFFLERRDVIVVTRGRAGVHDEARAQARGNTPYARWPMAVLVNGGSASAAEIVAGALQDHRRAVVIGETTFGKASVQSLINLKSNESTAIRLTIAHYFTPNGRAIHGVGIEPDIAMALPPTRWREIMIRRDHLENPDVYSADDVAEYAHVEDPHLERAADVLQGVLLLRP